MKIYTSKLSNILSPILLYATASSSHFLNAQNKTSAFQIKGSANAQIRYYNATKNKDTRPGFVANINAQPVFYIGKWQIPTRLTLGNYQTYFRDYNRYGIAPKYKNLTLYLGHTTLYWNKNILDSRPILGAGFELKPGKFRLGIFAGQINKAQDSATFRKRFFIPTYQRQMIAVKLGYGSENNFIEFTGLVGADKVSSLSAQKTLGVKPQANALGGIQGGLRVLKKLQLHANFTTGAYTENTSIDGKEYNKFSTAKIPGKLIKSNASTVYSNSFSVSAIYLIDSLKIKKKRLSGKSSAGVQYDQVDPFYRSMGLYYLISDIRRFRFLAQTRSKNGKVYSTLTFGLEHNNLKKTQFTTNSRNIYGITIGFGTGKNWNHTLSFQNFAVSLSLDGLAATDSLLLNQINRNIVGSSMGRLGTGKNQKMLQFQFGYQVGKNITAGTSIRNLGHLWASARLDPASISPVWALSPSYAYHKFVTSIDTTTRHIPGIGISKSFKANKILFQAECGAILTWYQHKYNTTGLRNSVFVQWFITKKQYLQCNVLYQPNRQKNNNFSEFQADLRWGLRF